MLPGVELARRRRVHYRGDAASSPSTSAGAGEHHHHHLLLLHADHAHRAGPAAVAGPALAARARLEEKLRGAALPPPATSPSRWSRLMMGERETSGGRRGRRDHHHQQQQQQAERELRAPPPAPATASAGVQGRRRAELTRTLSVAEVCAVCLDEVRERRQRVTRLPCSHRYHSECVLPWLAAHPDCPCCRALVPAAHPALLLR